MEVGGIGVTVAVGNIGVAVGGIGVGGTNVGIADGGTAEGVSCDVIVDVPHPARNTTVRAKLMTGCSGW